MKNVIYLGKTDEKTNPRDPFVFYKKGHFYHLFSKNDGLYIKESDTLEDLANLRPTKIFDAYPFKELWAPELHVIDDKCYIYVAMDDGDNFNHRMYVLENNSSNPLDMFHIHGQIITNPDKWAIDGSILRYQGKMYFIWSGWEGDVNVAQNIYIQEMKDQFSTVGERLLLSKPEFDWEIKGSNVETGAPTINEGPYAVYGEKLIHIVYSASGSWCDDYCLGLLTFKGGNIMDIKNWIKNDKPILNKTETALGPGHASFFDDPRSGKTYITYHLFNTDCRNGWSDTHAIIQEYHMENDYPVLDKPVNFFRDK